MYKQLIFIFATVLFLGCSTPSSKVSTTKNLNQTTDIQVFTTTNRDAKISAKSIERAFVSVGLTVPGNNNMNRPFLTRYDKLHYSLYNLAMYMHKGLSFKLLKKYPSFGLLTPLSMSIWEDKNSDIFISTLSLNGMSRVTGIPKNDPDLISYAALIHTALKAAMPDGNFKNLAYTHSPTTLSLVSDFSMKVEYDDQTIEEFIDDFEAEFEGEIEPLGFLMPNYTNVQIELFDDHNYTGVYDFYHTYSLCKFDVIYPVSKDYPEVGAWAPCSFYLYKKSNEEKMHMGFLSVENWITSSGMKEDEEGTKKLREAQGYLEHIITDMFD